MADLRKGDQHAGATRSEAGVDRDRIDSGWIAGLHARVGRWASAQREEWADARRRGGQLPLFDDEAVDLGPVRRDRSLWVVVGAAVVWSLVFGTLTWRRHEWFGSFGFDLAIYDQATWLLSRFDGQFITVRGLDVFGHHATLGLYLLVPFYWLGAGPHFLNLFQVAVAAAGAVPVYLLARHRLRSGWLAALLAAAFLLHPTLQFLAWEQFHPETVAVTPLLFAYWFSVRRRWGWFWVSTVLAMVWKEEIALAVLVLGLVVALRGDRRVGLLAAGLAFGWGALATNVLIPAVSGAEAFYVDYFFRDLGSTPAEVAWNAVWHPSQVADRVLDPQARRYLFRMTAPYAFLPVTAPLAVALGIPQLLMNLLSVNEFTRAITYHYAAVPLAALTLATVEGIAFLGRRPEVRAALVGLVALSSLVATVQWGLSPIGAEYERGWWAREDDPRRATKEAAVAMVPPGAAVTASYQFTPHLAHRKTLYQWPNPFRPKFWGAAGENYPPASSAEWIVVDRAIVSPDEEALLADVLAGGEFVTLLDRDAIVVARRLRPG